MRTNSKRTGSETRKREKIVGFRASEEERAEIEASASRAAMTLSSYVRIQTLSHPRVRLVRHASVDASLLSQTLGQLGKIGGNINQLAKRANSDVAIPRDDLDAALVELRVAASAILRALGPKK